MFRSQATKLRVLTHHLICCQIQSTPSEQSKIANEGIIEENKTHRLQAVPILIFRDTLQI